MKKKVFGYTKIERTVPIHAVLCNVVRSGIPSLAFWDGYSEIWRSPVNFMPLEWEPKEWAVWPHFPRINQEGDK